MTVIDDINTAEVILDDFASRVPGPDATDGAAGVIAGLFAPRTRDTFAGFVHAVRGPSLVAPVILVRPLIEGAILVRWMEEDPEARYALWQAHSESMDASAIRQLQERRPQPAGDPFSEAALAPMLSSKDGIVTAARAASGCVKPDRVLRLRFPRPKPTSIQLVLVLVSVVRVFKRSLLNWVVKRLMLFSTRKIQENISPWPCRRPRLPTLRLMKPLSRRSSRLRLISCLWPLVAVGKMFV